TLVDDEPVDPGVELARLDAGAGWGKVILDDAAGVLDHPAELVAVVLAVEVDVDLADQGEAQGAVRGEGGRGSRIAGADWVRRRPPRDDLGGAVAVVALLDLDDPLGLVGRQARGSLIEDREPHLRPDAAGAVQADGDDLAVEVDVGHVAVLDVE